MGAGAAGPHALVAAAPRKRRAARESGRLEAMPDGLHRAMSVGTAASQKGHRSSPARTWRLQAGHGCKQALIAGQPNATYGPPSRLHPPIAALGAAGGVARAAVPKSNMSSSASLFASLSVSAPRFQIASMRRVIDVCE